MLQERSKINYLMSLVEAYHPRPLKTSVDFEFLSFIIQQQVGERVSASTFKRLWGYVSDCRVPRRNTLDVLAKYIGYNGYQEFCIKNRERWGVISSVDLISNKDFKTLLQSKLLQALVQAGLVVEGECSMISLSTLFEVIEDADNSATTAQIFAKYSVTCNIINIVTGCVYASSSFNVVGIGDTEELAQINAVEGVDTSDTTLQSVIKDIKEKMERI